MMEELDVTELDAVNGGAANSYEADEADLGGALGIGLGALALFAAPEVAVPIAVTGLIASGEGLAWGW